MPQAKMDVFPEPAITEGVHVTVAITAPTVPGLTPGGPISNRQWLLGPGSPYAISSFLAEHNWSWVLDPHGRLHAASPDTTVYLGYCPDDHDTDTWTIAVTGTSCDRGWSATFDRDTPVELAIDFLAAMYARPNR
ncbi:DUF317 domain-containing protein [Kitasatospora indigofera]|uniref:DUF317 domain-containing protein n=1 Tax=Kitasatospora indigofera TaxID=67307 RepID=UPI003643D252